MIKNSLRTTITILIILIGAKSVLADTCIPDGSTSIEVMQALYQTGEASLCQGATITATVPMQFAGNNWKLHTDGYPIDNSLKATIVVPDNVSYQYAPVQAYWNVTGAQIRNIRIDGNRANNTYVPSRALLVASGDDTWVDQVYLTNTSGVSALAAADNPTCDGVRLTNNEVVNNGLHQLNAGVPQWADGIDIRCDNAVVSGNIIEDATDTGIGFFGGNNTLITNNVVFNDTRSNFAGILAGAIFGDSDFTGSAIRYNTVSVSNGQHLHVGISMGLRPWCVPEDPTNVNCALAHGIRLENNTLNGRIGFGLIVDGMQDATVAGNVFNVTEWTGQACYIAGKMKYTFNPDTASGTLQAGYKTRALLWPCAGPIDQ